MTGRGCSPARRRPWTGPQIQVSDDLGETWRPTGGAHFPEDLDTSVERIWQLVPAGESTVYAGTEPGAVFRSDDDGETFQLERALWDHPHRPHWGAGFGGQAFHTILPHPDDAVLGDGGDLDRRLLPDLRRRRHLGSRATTGSAPTSCPRTSATPSSASACTR